MSFKIFIQARMSSNRLPGKVLMDFRGLPIIQNVVNAVGADRCVVLTSTERSDDPLAEYLAAQNIDHFRGSLNDVYGRFCAAAQEFECERVMRICADSPLIPRVLIDGMIAADDLDADLTTNVHPRSFPKGHSVEIIKVKTLMAITDRGLTADHREHVTAYFYENADDFQIRSVTQPLNMNDLDLAVDTQEDYERLIDFDSASLHYDPKSWSIKSC